MTTQPLPSGKGTILQLTWEYPPHIVGGLARHVEALSRELAKIGYEIHVITASSKQSPDYEWRDGVHIHRVTPLNHNDPDFLAWIGGLNLAIVNKTESIARHSTIDAVHTHDWLTGPCAQYISSTMDIPMVATIHGTESGRNGGIFTDLQQFISAKEKELAHSADQLIVCSEFMVKEVSGLADIAEAKVEMIVNGAGIESIKYAESAIDDSFPFVQGKKVVFSIGRIVHEKGFDTIIAAAGSLKESHPHWLFIIAGNGPLLDVYRQKVRNLFLEDTVFFIGFISDAMRLALLQRCELAVFPSLYEPFGLAAAEALSAGATTIVAKTGGMYDLVTNFETGFHLDPGDADGLALLIKYIDENEQLRKKIGKQGQQSILKRFSWQQNALKTAEIYERLRDVNGDVLRK